MKLGAPLFYVPQCPFRSLDVVIHSSVQLLTVKLPPHVLSDTAPWSGRIAVVFHSFATTFVPLGEGCNALLLPANQNTRVSPPPVWLFLSGFPLSRIMGHNSLNRKPFLARSFF